MPDQFCPCEACKKRRFEELRSSYSPCVDPPKPTPTDDSNNVTDLKPPAASLSSPTGRYGANVRPIEQCAKNVEPMDRFGIDTRALEQFKAGFRPPERSGYEDAIVRYNTAALRGDGFNAGAETGFLYFLKETIGIIGFCVITTFCLWALLMRVGIQVLTKINQSDKRVRNAALLILLIISLVIFQGILLRKVKTLNNAKKSEVKSKPQKSTIVLAQPPITKGYWITFKSGVASMWINVKHSGNKIKVQVLEMWPERSNLVSKTSYYNTLKTKVYNIKTHVINSFKWPFAKRSSTDVKQKEKLQNIKPTVSSSWNFSLIKRSSTEVQQKGQLYKIKAYITSLIIWPFARRSSTDIKQKPKFCKIKPTPSSSWNLSLIKRSSTEAQQKGKLYKIKAYITSLFSWPYAKRSPTEAHLKGKFSNIRLSSLKLPFGNSSHTKVQQKGKFSNIKLSSLKLPSSKRSLTKNQARPSFWSSIKATISKMQATIMVGFVKPFRTSPSAPCTCPRVRRNGKLWSNWRTVLFYEGLYSIRQKIQLMFKAPPEDPKARELMQRSKLYAIPMEMKRPPQLLVSIRDYFQQ